MTCLRLALTPGEPAGIGPDLVCQLAQQGCEHELVAVASPALLEARAAALGLPLRLRTVDFSRPPQALARGELAIQPVELAAPATAGQLDPANGPYVLQTLEEATDGCREGRYQALITGPVQKSVINEAGVPFSGHTEWLAERCGVDQVVMMLATEGLRVALVTTHLPLKEVAAAITPQHFKRVLDILLADLRRYFGCEHPRVLVAGLNPHAGESGHMGREEIEVLQPVMAGYGEDCQLSGPLPADTLFTPRYLEHCDAVLAMYHDQGLPVLKYKGFGRAVNITLGLPIIRTSVDHGTALDLAGSGRAELGSLETALRYAVTMATHQGRSGH